MKTAKIFKEVNSIVWTIELYLSGEYQESAYHKTKIQCKLHAKKLGYIIE